MKPRQAIPAPKIIRENDFHALIASRTGELLKASKHFSSRSLRERIMTRPLLGVLMSQSMQIEELLDAYNARNNRRWSRFRALTAAIKLFADVSYELLHIQHALPAYRLLPIEHDFVKATEAVLKFTGGVLSKTTTQLVKQAEKLSLPAPMEVTDENFYSEQLPPGRLPHDRPMRKVETVAETVTLLATAFLNLAAESKLVRAGGQAWSEESPETVLRSMTEDKLRSLLLRFHNLQSLYDTHVSETEMENLDIDLPVLRGHISVVLHLLRTATSFAHYYERHVSNQPEDSLAHRRPVVEPDELAAKLVSYSITYASCYLACAQQLCQKMLKRYARVGRIDVAVPQYRGFHVRPSTLVAAIVLHYGSEMKMELDGESYNAALPLELFRANEKINAKKRRWLAAEIVRLQLVVEHGGSKDFRDIVRGVVLTLAEQSNLVMYEHPLQLSGEDVPAEGSLMERVVDAIVRLLVIGKIDVSFTVKATFVGDKRVLDDIQLLAESGYGEDNFGNNIPLPKELSYLRR